MLIIFSLLLFCGFSYIWSQAPKPFMPVQKTTSEIMQGQSEVRGPIQVGPSHKIRRRSMPHSYEIDRLMKEYEDARLMHNEKKASEIRQQLRAMGYEI